MAIPFRDKRATYFYRETLTSLLYGLIGKYTVIDLRNEASVYGKIVSVTPFMDVELEKCIFKSPKGDFYPFDFFYVKSRNIRYVHIPDGCKSQKLIEKGILESNLKPIETNKSKSVYKKKRAQNYQAEILKDLHSQQKQQNT